MAHPTVDSRPSPENDEGAESVAILKDYNSYRRKVLGDEAYEQKVDDGLFRGNPDEAARARRRKKQELKDALIQARATSMLAARIMNMSRNEVAEQFGVHPQTVTKTLNRAMKDGLITAAEDLILAKLVPKAINAYDKHLDDYNLEAARDILRGTGLTSERLAVAKAEAATGGTSEITIREIRARYVGGFNEETEAPVPIDRTDGGTGLLVQPETDRTE